MGPPHWAEAPEQNVRAKTKMHAGNVKVLAKFFPFRYILKFLKFEDKANRGLSNNHLETLKG
jgi:hypothetical protein